MKYSRYHINLLDEALATLRESSFSTRSESGAAPVPLHSPELSTDFIENSLSPPASETAANLTPTDLHDSALTSPAIGESFTATNESPRTDSEPELSLIEKAALRAQQMKDKSAANSQSTETVAETETSIAEPVS